MASLSREKYTKIGMYIFFYTYFYTSKYFLNIPLATQITSTSKKMPYTCNVLQVKSGLQEWHRQREKTLT